MDKDQKIKILEAVISDLRARLAAVEQERDDWRVLCEDWQRVAELMKARMYERYPLEH